MTPQQAFKIAMYRTRPEMLKRNSMLFKSFCKHLAEAHQYVSLDELRTITCKDACEAYYFALYIDKEFSWETYQAVFGTKYEMMYTHKIIF